MYHADVRREEAAVTAVKPGSALLCDPAVWYLVWVCGRACVFCGGMGDAMGSRMLLTKQSGSHYHLNRRFFFLTGCANRIKSTKFFFYRVKSPIWSSVGKAVFD